MSRASIRYCINFQSHGLYWCLHSTYLRIELVADELPDQLWYMFDRVFAQLSPILS